MYVPDYFKPTDDDVRELLAHFGAAELITATPTGLRATMLPMVHVADGQGGVLRGHFARKNDHWRQPVIGEALAIIGGPNAYITPTWYATKVEHGRVVPTWNYVTAHIYGELSIHDDPAWVEANVRALTAKYERAREPRWAVDDAPTEYVSGQLRAIVGVEVRITRVDAKFKLSQNRSSKDVDGVIDGLTTDGDEPMAAAVARAATLRGTGG